MYRLGCLYIIIFLFAVESRANPPIKFLENKGQWPEQVDFVGNLPGGKVFFEQDRLLYNFYEASALDRHSHDHEMSESGCESGQVTSHAYSVRFLNANPRVNIVSDEPSSEVVYSYFVGNKSRWASGVREFDHVKYVDLYDGIDLVYKKYFNSVKYDFVVHSGAAAENIELAYSGPDRMRLVPEGLSIETGVNSILEKNPIAFQYINGKRVEVECHYALLGNILSFEFPSGYDECYDLTIDPELVFSTFSGSTADNWGNTATFDRSGNLYSGGITSSHAGGSFPATEGAYQIESQGLWDVAILKYDSTGTSLIYATYLGGSVTEVPQSMVVNSANELYVLGVTGSSDFPVTDIAFDKDFSGGPGVFPFGGGDNNVTFPGGTDLFITRLSADGSDLVNSTLYGGSDNDGIDLPANELVFNYGDQLRGDIFIDKDGSILVASRTSSTDYPVLSAIKETYSGGETDGIVFRMSSDLSTQIWSTYFGGSGEDAAYSVKTNSSGEVIIGGGTNSDNLADIDGHFEETLGGTNGWVAKLSADGSDLVGGRYVGGSLYDQVYFVDLDLSDNIYTYGQTAGDFTDVGIKSVGDGQFLQKYSSDLTSITFARQFGSSNSAVDISPTAFLVSECDKILVSGWGGDTNYQGNTFGMPITRDDAYQETTSGSDFYLAAFSEDGKDITYATYLGGRVSRTHVDGGTSRFDERGIVYHAVCAGCANNSTGQAQSDFPTTQGAFSRTNNSQNCNNAAFKFDLVTLKAVVRSNTPDFANEGIDRICLGEKLIFENFSSGGQEYIWNLGDGADFLREDKNFIQHEYKSSGIYTVKLKAMSSATCIENDVDSLLITVVDNDFDLVDDAKICIGESFRLSASGAMTYEWSLEDGTVLTTSSSFNVSPTESTRYLVKMSNDLCDVENSVLVEVIPDVSLQGEVSLINDCFDRPSVRLLNNSSDVSFDFEWSLGDGTISDQKSFVYNYARDGRYTIKLKAVNDICEFENTFNVNIQSPPTLFVVQGDSICEGDQFDLRASGASVYEWSNRIEGVFSNQSSVTVSPQRTTTYIVKATRGECSKTDSVLVQVTPSLNMDLQIEKIEDCFSRPKLNLTNVNIEGRGRYTWQLGDGSSSDQESFVYDYEEDGEYNVRLIGEVNDCRYETMETVELTTVKVPNVIFSSAKGTNEKFTIIAGERVDLKIFNRWGKVIFEMNNYDNSWDGSKQSTGVYYYEAKIGQAVCSGWLHSL